MVGSSMTLQLNTKIGDNYTNCIISKIWLCCAECIFSNLRKIRLTFFFFLSTFFTYLLVVFPFFHVSFSPSVIDTQTVLFYNKCLLLAFRLEMILAQNKKLTQTVVPTGLLYTGVFVLNSVGEIISFRTATIIDKNIG